MWLPHKGTLEVDVAEVFAEATISGGSGAVDAASYKGKGVASIAKTGTGQYAVTLQDSYNRLMSGDVSVQVAVAGFTASVSSSNVQTASGGTVVVQFYDASGSAANPPNCVWVARLALRNSSVQ
jgi:hypothetical protein